MAEALFQVRRERVIGGDAGSGVGLGLRGVTDVGHAQVDVAALVVILHRAVIAIRAVGSFTQIGVKAVGVIHCVAVAVVLRGQSAGMGGTAGRCDLRLVEGHGNDLVTAEIAHIANFDHQIVARLVLEIEREIDAVRQFVGAIVDAENEGLLRVGARHRAIDNVRGVGEDIC